MEEKKNILTVEAPFGESRILLHSCCAPCSSAIVECLLHSGITPVIYYFNPNIYPEEEYMHRKEECSRFAAAKGLEIVDADYDHSAWLEGVRGLEGEPERGARCLQCFRYRLLSAARYARDHGIRVVTTTLASSRWKSLEQINAAGGWACRTAAAETETATAPVWWDRNWRKDGLQQRRQELLKEYEFYNQLYCGCEFSIR